MSLRYRFMHTSDWHLGATRNLTYPRLEYLDRQVATLNKFVEAAKSADLDFILISGDIFEDSDTTIPELLAAYRLFTELGKICPVLITAGNHDELQKGEFQTIWFDILSVPNVHFISKPTTFHLKTRTGTVEVAAFPWTGIKDQDQFDLLVAENVVNAEVVMLHECFYGSVLDNGRRYPKGVKVPEIPGVKYFACGDIHKMQQINLPHAWFSGAPMQYRFNDDPKKGYLLVEAHEGQEMLEPKFVRVKSDVELKIIHDMKDYDPHSPTWYSLYCPANKMPLEQPNNLKKVTPQPVVVEMKAVDAKQPNLLERTIDYAEGVSDIMNELGFTPDQIQTEQDSIRKLASLEQLD